MFSRYLRRRPLVRAFSTEEVPDNFNIRDFLTQGQSPTEILEASRRSIVGKRRLIDWEHERRAKAMGLEWRIVSASILHRYPTIAAEPDAFDREPDDFDKMIHDRFLEDMAKGLEGVKTVDGKDAAEVMRTRITDEEIMSTLPFTPASPLTPADYANDRRSLDRRLYESLFLIVKRNREDHAWQFPQGKIDLDENARQAAERILDRAVGKIRRYFIANSPMGHYLYAYPPAVQKQRNQYGAKVFFYRAQLIQGNIKVETKLYKDYAWVSWGELAEYMDTETDEYLRTMLF